MTTLTSVELTRVGLEAADRDEVLATMAGELADAGIVADTYLEALLAREARYPTGLPTGVMRVAIPHTDPEHVHRSAIAIARLARPVAFHEMGASARTVDVELVVMLAIAERTAQVGTLQAVIGMFSDAETMTRLRDAPDAASLHAVVAERTAGLAVP